MLLRLPRGLHYPITITKVLKKAGANVVKDEPIFLYTYETTVREGSRNGEDRYIKKLFAARFESGLEGQLRFWKVWEGDVLDQPYVYIYIYYHLPGRAEKGVFDSWLIGCPGPMSPRSKRNAHTRSNLPACVPIAART